MKDFSLRAESQWIALEEKIRLLAKLSDSLEEHIRKHFERVVKTLCHNLQVLTSKIDDIAAQQTTLFGKAKYALSGKRALKEAILSFTTLDEPLLPSFFLLTRIQDPVVDQTIKNEPSNAGAAVSTVQNLRKAFKDLSVVRKRKTPEEVEEARATKDHMRDSVDYYTDNAYWTQRQPIKYTAVQIHKIPGENDVLLIDAVPCDSRSGITKHIVKDVQELAWILRSVDPMIFGIPSCAGVARWKNPDTGRLTKIEMVFRVPKDLVNPRSLRSLLISGGSPSTNERVELAKRLARTVSFVHSAQFVHKNVRPETIIILDSVDKPDDQIFTPSIGLPFLIGFQRVRSIAGGHTTMMGDGEWEKDLYRHPERQGERPEESYTMQHDIYSLGVCLLEIALWKSFVLYDADDKPKPAAETETLLNGRRSGWDTEEKLIIMAKELVPRVLGCRYAEVIISCLKGLDESGTSEGVSFIETVSPSGRISILL